jgi:Mn2+/Fe2+ NRAMP family transporter
VAEAPVRVRPVEPSAERVEKSGRRGRTEEAATGGPPAGRTTVEQARRQGVGGWFQHLGPGLVTGASDDDPSGIGTYSQVGSQFGYGMLWMALFTFPLMAAVQELCARIALQTGVGLGVCLRRKFPTAIVAPAILALVIANTINLGADLGAVAAGGELLTRGFIRTLWLVVPAAALVVALQFFVSYATIFKVFKWLTLALFAYVLAGLLAHPNIGRVIVSTVVPHVEFSKEFIQAAVAVLGTTISPYLFFWQASSEVDEMKAGGVTRERLGRKRGVATAELKAARFDIMVGMFFSQLIMYFIILTAAATLNAHGKTDIQTAQQAAAALEPIAGPFAFILFAAGLIGTGLLAIPILSGSAAYAVKEFLGIRGSLAMKPQYRPTFYLIMAAATITGVAMNFMHIDPIRALFVTAVINGVVAPPLLVLIVLLGSDKAIMKSKASGTLSRALTWTATGLMGLAAMAMFATMLVR